MTTKSVLCCIDKRFDSLVSQYYDSIGQTEDYYMITAAGSSLPLSYLKMCHQEEYKCCSYKNCLTNKTLREGQLTNFNISMALSDIVQLDIMDHQDCGAFRVFLPCANLPSGELTVEEKEHEKKVHAQSLNFAEKSVTKRVPSFTNPIVKLLIDLNGTVGKLNEDGSWTIIYVGPGSNPNGLWWS